VRVLLTTAGAHPRGGCCWGANRRRGRIRRRGARGDASWGSALARLRRSGGRGRLHGDRGPYVFHRSRSACPLG